MFDELLSQMEDVLNQTKNLKGPGKSSGSDNSAAEGYIDPTKTYGKVASFSKSQRFKPLEKQTLKTSDIQWPKPTESVVLKTRRFSFSKKERFQTEKVKYAQTYINPDFNLVKKNNKNNVPIYRSPSKTLADSKVSISTVDSQTFRAPGLYNPKQEVKVKNGAFSKDNRFKLQKQKYQDTPLMINQNQTRKRPPMSSVMKPRTVKNKQLISRQQQEELRQKLKLIYWRNIPLEFDRLFKNNTGPIMRQDYFLLHKLTGTQKRSALLMMMDRLNYLRGGFQQNISGKMDAACGVIYRKSTPKPFKFSEMDPGPDYYYPADDYVKPQPVGFSFGREGLKEKIIEYDYRDYQIKEEIMKKGGNIVINPIHQQHRLTQDQLTNLQRGPGFYDCIFKLTQKRTDIGAVAYQQITLKNARQNNCIEIKEVNDGIYFPSYQAIDPNVPAPLYKDPANVKPEHLPDKLLFPEHWLFYDGNLNKVRAQIAKNVILAKNMNFKEYKNYKEKFNRFKQYLEIQRKGPEPGQYTVKYQALDPHIPNIEFSKQQEKTLIEPITKPEGDYDGDNLILNPQQPKSHLPNIDFKKMEGRPQADIDRNGEPNEGDRLILQPKKPQKHVPNVNFQKQEGRPESSINKEDQPCPQGDILIINPKRVEPHIPKIDFARQADRPEIRIQQNENEEVNIVNLQQEQPRIKGVPFSRLSSVRLVPHLRQKSKIQKADKDQKDEEGN